MDRNELPYIAMFLFLAFVIITYVFVLYKFGFPSFLLFILGNVFFIVVLIILGVILDSIL